MSQTYTPESLPAVLTITVTQADVDHGKAADCESCPAARALARTYPVSGAVWRVRRRSSKLVGENFERAFLNSEALLDAIDRFDGNIRISSGIGKFPGTFTLTRRTP